MTSVPSSYRVRFAPAPTGMMHLGNVKTALMNYLFAQQKNGQFILRIEDTDESRNFDPEAKEIIADLEWLGIHYDEGPKKGGPHAPYFQSQRTALYQEKLDYLKNIGAAYPCFCTPEELEKKRTRQQALKQPPRYDRACLMLSPTERYTKITSMPHLWRLQLDYNAPAIIHDLSHGTITFDLKNFSDFPLTRMDGSFTFIFANFVDDMTMEITHVFRGDDHLTNTANQAALYHAFGHSLPIFWHMPILCNIEGKKLSKRDFGFSLRDLKKSGYLPEAINNYLAILGGSYEKEIMSLPELIMTLQFDHLHSASHIKYDVEKLNWVNRQWIARLTEQELVNRIIPFMQEAFGEDILAKVNITELIHIIKSELTTLHDAVENLRFIFQAPRLTSDSFAVCGDESMLTTISSTILAHKESIADHNLFLSSLKKDAKRKGISFTSLFQFLRISLTGNHQGENINNIMKMLGTEKTIDRINAACGIFA